MQTNQGSDKAWRLLNNDNTPFALYLAVSVLTPIEDILNWHFVWQNNLARLSSSMQKVPVVVMGNMSKSPAAIAMNQLVGFLFTDVPDMDMETTSDLLKNFLGLPTGSMFWQ